MGAAGLFLHATEHGFPFFPIIDYIQFRRSYYDRDAITIYQKGVLWMLRGAIHLILYRVVYYYYTPAVEDVEGLAGVVLFIVSAYMLYLRVSGLFHLIIGHHVSLRVQPARDTQAVFPGFQLQRLLAAHQHLLEGLHDEALLLPGLHENPLLGANQCAGV